MVKTGDKIDLEIIRVTDDKRGIGLAEDGMVVMIENVNEDETNLTVEITRVFQETAFAKKISAGKGKNKLEGRKDLVDSPYSLDEDDDKEDDD